MLWFAERLTRLRKKVPPPEEVKVGMLQIKVYEYPVCHPENPYFPMIVAAFRAECCCGNLGFTTPSFPVKSLEPSGGCCLVGCMREPVHETRRGGLNEPPFSCVRPVAARAKCGRKGG